MNLDRPNGNAMTLEEIQQRLSVVEAELKALEIIKAELERLKQQNEKNGEDLINNFKLTNEEH